MKAKLLVLVRHADSEPAGARPDLERELTAKGRRQALSAAERWLALGGSALPMIASPARRAIETAELFAVVLEKETEPIRTEDALYWSHNPADVVQFIRSLPDSWPAVMLFGHNPLLSDLGQILAGEPGLNMSKGALLALRLEVRHWGETEAGCGRIEAFERP